MLSVSRLLNGTVEPGDALRYGRSTARGPAHLLHYTADKNPVVVWNVTQRCNLHCAHCYSSSKNRHYPGELDTAEGHELLRDLGEFGVPTVLFSGGEPLMRDDLFELAGAASDRGLRTVLSTNGTHIDREVAERIAAAGFSYVGISLDGPQPAHDKIRGSRGAFAGAVSGIERCQEAGLRTGIRYTVHGLNRQHLGEIFGLAESLSVDRLCVYHLAYAGRGDKLRAIDLEPGETRELVNEIFRRTEDLGRRGVPLEVLTVDNPVDNVLLYMRVAERKPERAADIYRLLSWNGGNQSGIAVACVDPRGNVHPDQFSWQVTAGNVRERPFSEIWSDSRNLVLRPYRQRPRKLKGRCRNCAWEPLCNGGLRVRAESATGDAAAPDPACYLSDAEIARGPHARSPVPAA